MEKNDIINIKQLKIHKRLKDWVCVCVCHDHLGDETIGKTNPEPSKTTEEHTDDTKADPVNEEKPLRPGTESKQPYSSQAKSLWTKLLLPLKVQMLCLHG